MDKPRRTTETSGSDCRELGGRLKPVADWEASRQREARAAKRRPSVSTASTIQRDKFGVRHRSCFGAAICSQPARRWQKSDAESVVYRSPNWQHAHRYSRILGKSITRTNPFWLVNVSVWSALCACATPEMR